MLQIGVSERSIDTLATSIYLDMQKADLDQNKVDKIKTTLNEVNVNASGLFLVHAIDIALETYIKYDLVK